MRLQLTKICPRYHLATVLLLFPPTALLLWANLQQRVVVSRPFDLGFSQPCVDVYVSNGWPVRYRSVVYLVLQDGIDDLLGESPERNDWFERLDVDAPPVDSGPLAIDVAVGLFIVLGLATGSELIIRYLARRRRTSTGNSRTTYADLD